MRQNTLIIDIDIDTDIDIDIDIKIWNCIDTNIDIDIDIHNITTDASTVTSVHACFNWTV